MNLGVLRQGLHQFTHISRYRRRPLHPLPRLRVNQRQFERMQGLALEAAQYFFQFFSRARGDFESAAVYRIAHLRIMQVRHEPDRK